VPKLGTFCLSQRVLNFRKYSEPEITKHEGVRW